MPKVSQQLDWFHIGMKLRVLRQVVRLPMTYREFLRNRNARDHLGLRVLCVRDSLWRGHLWRAMLNLARLRSDAIQWRDCRNVRSSEAMERLERTISELGGYSGGNRRAVPSFARARAAGRRISTAHVESVMSHLVDHRMSKKHQMRWGPSGAYYVLQVRAEIFNGRLLDRYRELRERFRTRMEYETASRALSTPALR